MFKWAKDFGVEFFVSAIRSSLSGLEVSQWKYIVFSVPYGMWVISFCCFIGAIWDKDRSLSAVIWRFLAPVIAISSEVLQFLGLLPGTYDINDLYVLIVATIVGLVMSNL